MVTLEDIDVYADRQVVNELISKDSELEALRKKGDQGRKAAAEQERLIRARGAEKKKLLRETDIDGDGTVELHEFFRVRCQQLLTERGIEVQGRPHSLSVMPLPGSEDDHDEFYRDEDDDKDEQHCGKCGKQLIPGSLFCTK